MYANGYVTPENMRMFREKKEQKSKELFWQKKTKGRMDKW